MSDTTRAPALCWHWQLLADEWLLRAVLAFLEEDDDGIHCIWLLAVDDEFTALRRLLEQHFSVSMARARRIAMVHSCWSILRKLADGSSGVKYPTNPRRRLSEKTIETILQELHGIGIPSHPDRRQALTIAIEYEHRHARSPEHSCPRCASHSLVWSENGLDCPMARRTHYCTGQLPFVLYAAARRGLLESVVWLHYVACYDQRRALQEAAKNGHPHVVAWLLKHAHKTVIVVWKYEHDQELGIMAWREAGTPQGSSNHSVMTKKWGFSAFYGSNNVAALATKCGDVEGLRRISNHSLFGSNMTFWVADTAAQSGDIPVLEFLLENHPSVFEKSRALQRALEGQQMDAAQWLVKKKCQNTDAFVCQAAVKTRSATIVEWLLDTTNDSETIRQWISKAVAAYPSLEVVQWLVEERGFQASTQVHGASSIHADETELVKWLVDRAVADGSLSNGPELLEASIDTGNHELVQWLIHKRGIWSRNAFRLASKRKSAAVLSLVYEAALRQDPTTALVPERRPLLDPGNVETTIWLLEHGYRTRMLQRCFVSRDKDHIRYRYQLTEAPAFLTPPSWIGRRRDFMTKFIEVYDPIHVRMFRFTRHWAAHHGPIESLEKLATIGRYEFVNRRVFDSLLVETGREATVKWFLQTAPCLLTPLVVKWATKHGKYGLLAWVFQTLLAHRDLACRGSKWTRNCVRTVLVTATKFGRVDVIRDLQQWTHVACDPSLWHGLDKTLLSTALKVD